MLDNVDSAKCLGVIPPTLLLLGNIVLLLVLVPKSNELENLGTILSFFSFPNQVLSPQELSVSVISATSIILRIVRLSSCSYILIVIVYLNKDFIKLKSNDSGYL